MIFNLAWDHNCFFYLDFGVFCLFVYGQLLSKHVLIYMGPSNCYFVKYFVGFDGMFDKSDFLCSACLQIFQMVLLKNTTYATLP